MKLKRLVIAADAVGKGAGMERKVIFHVDECGRFEMAAGNIHNMCSFYRGREIPVVIELLLNGEAVRAAAAAARRRRGAGSCFGRKVLK